ncbi:hypothetical protein KFL_003320080 [Klebsormidium nitens]|uniref:Protein SCAR n=1 Tax=Klebsormidium nitens TaxID=105231 RepID=A0A1Y1I817_KLENI|nr:hypothetical protein KFL_003320080 [Klebsormidium nitens]|eukprot:GAQ87115.1 hypothetical protein KFL_003320080 [Klebsormidium nitens]
MPLLKLRLKEEQALALPDIYRQAPKDDPRALLEAANFADLVGVVRQLGELSDYAAVMFSQLHAETSRLGARGEAMAARASALEESMPEAEIRVFTAQDTRQLLPNDGLKWHSSPHEDQTLFTSSELPPYISEAYMKAQPPPPLHMLDRFDRTASDGGALRRYSDPYFFKREWALAELAQAEREKKAMKARRKAKHLGQQRSLRDLNEGAYVRQASRSRRNSRSNSQKAAATPPPQRPAPAELPEQPQRYSVYVPDEPKTPDSQRYSVYVPGDSKTRSEGDPPTPASQGTISPYVESSFASLGDASRSVPQVPHFKNAERELKAPANGLRTGVAQDEIVAIGKVNEVAKTAGYLVEANGESSGREAEQDAQEPRRERTASRDVAEDSPAAKNVPEPDKVHREGESALFDQRTGPDEAVTSNGRTASQTQAIPRARRRSTKARRETPRKSDGETENAFPRAESFDSVTQAARVREQIRREAEGALANERSETRGAAGLVDERGGVEASVAEASVGKLSDLEAEWVASACDGEGRPQEESGKVAQEEPSGVGERSPADHADVIRGVSKDVSEEQVAPAAKHKEENGRLAAWASVPGSPVVGEDSAPGSPMNPGLVKLQQEYQQAQARLEALLRMQKELEEQAHPPETGAAVALGTVSSATSLAVELSRSSGGAGPADDSPPETVDIDSPPWSQASSPPLHEPGQLRRFMDSPARPIRHSRSVLDSPGPAFAPSGRGALRMGSSSRLSPPRELSPGGFSSPPFSSPERSSPLRRPWVMQTPPRPETEDEYRPSGLSTQTSLPKDRSTNGGGAAEPRGLAGPVPPTAKSAPKPPPPPPPGSLGAFKKPSQSAPPPPPPPLAPGALTITGPSSSRGGAARPVDLMQAIAQHDKGKLKRVDERSGGVAAPTGDRNVMLEQIKKGVNLRRTETVKAEEKPSRPVTDINVASILERANAIRQAMQDSDDDEEDEDEEDDWLD